MTIYKIGAVISMYKKIYPDVTFSLINDYCHLLRERLHLGELDIAITLEPKVSDPQLTTTILSEEQLVFVGEINHTIPTIEEADGECIIFSANPCELRHFFEGYLIENEISTNNNLEFTSMEAMKQCVVSGLGISLMPHISVDALLQEDKMKIIKSSTVNPTFYAQISYHRNKWLSKAHEKFIEMVLEKC